MTRFIALLRGINVSGRNTVPMAELRALSGRLGWSGAATYINSGNLVFTSGAKPAELESALEAGILDTFGLTIPVIVRPAEAWPAYIAGNPFPEAAKAEPNRLMLCLSKRPLLEEAGATLRERARDGERITQIGGALWVHYPAGAGSSRLSPTLFDRLAGSTVTTRNWRTTLKLGEMLA